MGEDGFKHISVTAAEDEDVVIDAGVSPEPVSRSVGQEEYATETPPERETHPEREPRPEKVQRGGSGKRLKSEDYRETTLADLKGEPMSLTQKVVIVAAIICIIGALIYYFAFMR